MKTKFRTKKGRGPVCYRQSKKIKGEVHWSKDYYRRVVRAGKSYRFRLGPDSKLAETISNEIDEYLRDPRNSVEDALLRFNPDAAYHHKKGTTLGAIIEEHEKMAPVIEIAEGTAKNYRTRLMWAVRRVVSHRTKKPFPKLMPYKKALEECKNFPIKKLNEKFIIDLLDVVMKEAGDSPRARNIAKRNLNSTMSDARAVFSEVAIRRYLSKGIEVPDMDSFLKTKLFQRVSSQNYRLPSDSVIKKLFKDASELRSCPNAYRIYLLALYGGLRRKEILFAEWEWVNVKDDSKENAAEIILPVTDDFEQKGKGETVSELSIWAYRELCNIANYSEGRIIEGTTRDGELGAKHLIEWLHQKGLNRRKPIHELRMLFGSWVANRRGLYAAQKLLRHKDAQVTSDHYADLIPDETILSLWEHEKKKVS